MCGTELGQEEGLKGKEPSWDGMLKYCEHLFRGDIEHP